MKDLGAAGCQSVRFIIAQVMEKFGFDGVVRIRSINPVHVGPDHKLFCVHYVSDDRAGEIGAIAAKCGDTAIGSGADETGDDGNEVGFDERQENVATALFGFLQLRFGFAEGVASENEIGRGDRHSGDAGFFEGGSEKACAEAFAEGGEAIGEFGACDHAALRRHFVEKIAAEELEAEADAVVLLFTEMEILKNVEMQMKDALGFISGMGRLAFGESARDGEEAIRDALHRRDDDDDV